MRNSFRLFRIGGIDVGIHYTWIFIFLLVTWSLAQGFFPQQYPGWDIATYWATGAAASVMLFVSVLLHELAHSFVARARGMSVSSITLFIFGGVSNLEQEPEKPGIEFVMSIVGPLTSLVLAGVFFVLVRWMQGPVTPLMAMLSYLALINAILAGFNLLPGFPLDGGRVLRSIIWGATGNLVKATNIAGWTGRTFGWLLIAYGLFSLLSGNFLGGIWIAFIGWFLSSAADASRREVTLREQLSHVRVKDIMNTDQQTIGPDTPVGQVVQDIFRRRHGRAVPVCQGDRLVGIVTITDVRELPPEKWADTPVKDIMTREPLYMVKPEDDLNTALKMIAQHDVNQVLVIQEGQCAGILGRADIIGHLQFTQEMGMGGRRRS